MNSLQDVLTEIDARATQYYEELEKTLQQQEKEITPEIIKQQLHSYWNTLFITIYDLYGEDVLKATFEFFDEELAQYRENLNNFQCKVYLPMISAGGAFNPNSIFQNKRKHDREVVLTTYTNIKNKFLEYMETHPYNKDETFEQYINNPSITSSLLDPAVIKPASLYAKFTNTILNDFKKLFSP